MESGFDGAHGSKSFIGYRALCMEKSGYKRSSSTQATRKKMHQLNDETSLVFTESLRASLWQIAKSARPTAMPIDTSINRLSATNQALVDRGTSITITRVMLR